MPRVKQVVANWYTLESENSGDKSAKRHSSTCGECKQRVSERKPVDPPRPNHNHLQGEVLTKEFVRVIHGLFSEDFFWYDDSESDPEFLDHWDGHFSPESSDDWGWDEWGDLVVYRPVGYEPGYEYPLVVWLSLDDVAGVTLRDWFPDLSDRNYLGAEVQLSAELNASESANRVSLAIREVAALYRVHRRRIWIAGAGRAADAVLRLLSSTTGLWAGGIAIAPTAMELLEESPTSSASAQPRMLYLAAESGADHEGAETILEDRDQTEFSCHLTAWESIEASRLAICRDVNGWLMQQVCAPVGRP